jgi:hypothetical protein
MAELHNHNLVAVRDAKERALELLSGRYSEDLIDADELDRRLERVERAVTLEEIAVITDDLLDPGATLMPRLGGEEARPSSERALAVPASMSDRRDMVAVFSERRYEGEWSVSRRIESLTVFGSTVIDLRAARIGSGVTEIDVKVLVGCVMIIVRPGLPVEIHCRALLGAVERDEEVSELSPVGADEHASRLRVRGFVCFGAVEIRERLPGESARVARRRLKLARKMKRKLARRERKARAKALGRGS